MSNEKRLIDANAIPYEEHYVPDGDVQWGYKKELCVCKPAIDQMPTVDAVEVVRCKECKCAYINFFLAASGVAVCKHWSNEAKTVIVQQDDFCSYGERREGE